MRSCPYCHVLFGPCTYPQKEHIQGHLEDRLKSILRKYREERLEEYKHVIDDARKYGIGELSAESRYRWGRG